MSERILKILLSELKTVRLLCQAKGCQGITELPVSKLKKGMTCPLCREEFDASGFYALHELATAFRLLDSVKDHVQLEFVVPDSSPATPS